MKGELAGLLERWRVHRGRLQAEAEREADPHG